MDFWKSLLWITSVCAWFFTVATVLISPLFFIPFALCMAIIVWIVMYK